MSFDSSRVTFDAWKNFFGVVMQQGRVQLDADWNELVAQLVHRIQTGTFDTFEHAVVPKTTPDGFLITHLGNGVLTIGRGRMYVDGILVENHGDPSAKSWEPHLAELIGGGAVNFAAQPYLPPGPAGSAIPTTPGPHLVYLDVWRREITHLTHPELIEAAVGVETTGRYQTIWQVKILDNVGAGVNCATPGEDISKWTALIRPSAGRLTTATGGPPPAEDPCQVPPTGGYKGRENQLYRVEIHEGGAAPTFKWSRDNASLQSKVLKIEGAGASIVVDSIGRDEVLSFHEGDWVEITDDHLELQGQPGVMAQIGASGVDPATRTITFATAFNAGAFPVNGAKETTASRHTRIRRWDHRGKVVSEDGALHLDLDASTGAIPVPLDGTRLLLENGILVDFHLDPGGGQFRSGDHWSFAARTADADIEKLDRAPPLGVHHHYARLAMMTQAGVLTSCRTFWPPDVAEGGEDCACDACVTPEGHLAGTATIQQAIDKVTEAGGGVICLRPGKYLLETPLSITGVAPLRIQGRGWQTMLIAQNKERRALDIHKSLGLVLENFTVIGADADGQATLISARDTVALEMGHLYVLGLGREGRAVALGGYSLKTHIDECVLAGATAVSAGGSKEPSLLVDLKISDCLLFCSNAGLAFGRNAVSLAHNVIARNLIFQRGERRQTQSMVGGIIAVGGALKESSFSIESNTIHVDGSGIIAGLAGVKILNNEIHATGGTENSGVVLDGGLDPDGIDHLWVCGNHISKFANAGIEARIPVRTAMIKQNIIRNTDAGIVFPLNAPSEEVAIENNQLLDLATAFNVQNGVVAAIQIFASGSVDISGNVIRSFAENAIAASARAAIQVFGSQDVRIAANRMSELGPKADHAGYVAGIDMLLPYTRCTVSENTIERTADPNPKRSAWSAILARSWTPKDGPDFIKTKLIERPEVFFFSKVFGLVFFSAANHFLVRGNQITASASDAPLVGLLGLDSSIFAENYVRLIGDSKAVPVTIFSSSAIVSNNRVDGSDGKRSVTVDAVHSTILGNITSRSVTRGGEPIGNNGPLNVVISP